MSELIRQQKGDVPMSHNRFQIRPASADDTLRIVELENIMRRPALTLEDFERQEAARSADHPYLRFVAEQDGHVIGVCGGGRSGWLKPGYMWCMINVDPAFRRQGVGRALYQALQEFYEKHQPEEIHTTIIDDHQTTLAWCERLGFRTHNHTFHSELDLSQFNSTDYSELMHRLAEEGIRFISYPNLRTPENDKRLFELFEVTAQDVPFSGERSELTRVGFIKRFLEDPTSWPEAIVVAVDREDRWLGMTNIFRSSTSPKEANLGFTGVLREGRGRGLALALKVAGLELMKQHGIQKITTSNHAVNKPILAVNHKMGYVKKEGMLALSKPFANQK